MNDTREQLTNFATTKPVYVEDFGNRLQVKGIIYGNGESDLIMYLPNEIQADHRSFPNVTQEQWEKIIKHSDNPNLIITDPLKRIIKAIISKNKRQVQEAFRWSIFKRDGFTCVYCGATDRPLTIDEYLCQALGGPISEENCNTACRPCNKAKADKTPEEWETYRKERGLVYVR